MISDWAHDPLQSFSAGQELAPLRRSLSKHPIADRRLAFWVELLFVSICHSTNWDRLHEVMIQFAQRNPEALEPAELLDVYKSETSELGRALASTPNLAERLSVLAQVGQAAIEIRLLDRIQYWAASGVTLSGGDGLYATLDQIETFSEDPLRKKSRVLAHQLSASGLVAILDPDSLAPAIDYHLIRLYMRTNRIHPRDKRGYDAFAVPRTMGVESLTRIRAAVDEAMHYTAEGAELRIDELNDVEWQIARSFCTRDRPRCNEGPLEEKPVSEGVLELSIQAGGCPLRGVCLGRHIPTVQGLQEPTSTKSFY